MTVLIGVAVCLLCVLVGVVWLAKESGIGLLGLLVLSFCAVADRQRKPKLRNKLEARL